MEFESRLESGVLIKRYKRFLADIKLADGRQITIHCPNTGSMKNCQEPGSRVWFTTSKNKSRKYPHTWQLIELDNGDLVGVNTGLANKLVLDSIQMKIIDRFQRFSRVRTEVPYGRDRSRIDILLEDDKHNACYIEVKNVSFGNSNGEGFFPDAVTTRGQKHLRELMFLKKSGIRAVLFFCVQHAGINSVAPAKDIDPAYSDLLKQAHGLGVEVIAYRFKVDLDSSRIELERELAVKV